MDPIYSVVARQLKALAPDVVMARVDATVETELAKDYDVTGYPTLIMFRKGKQYEYQGPRTEKGTICEPLTHYVLWQTHTHGHICTVMDSLCIQAVHHSAYVSMLVYIISPLQCICVHVCVA